MNQELLAYVKSAKQHNMSDGEIRQNLHNAGWEGKDIEEAILNYAAASGLAEQVLSPVIKPSAGAEAAPAVLGNIANTPKKNNVKVILSILALVLLGGAGAFAYVFGYHTPNQVWSKFLTAKKSEVYDSKFSLSYKDNNASTSSSAEDSILGIKSIFLKFDGDVYLNSADKSNPESTADVQYTFGSGDTNFNTGFKYRLKGNVIYLNIGSNPLLDMATAGLVPSGQEKPEWLKIDTKALMQGSGQDSSSLESLGSVFTPELSNQISEVWKNAKIVKLKKFKGFEKVSGSMTMHFENELDKEAFKSVIIASVQKLADASKNSGSTSPEEIQSGMDLATKIVGAIVEKIQVTNFETWVGVKNFNLYKVKFSSNAPSVLAALGSFQTTMSDASFQARDTRRYSDIQQLSSALELYYKDNGGYPEALNGKPVGLEPGYIYKIPDAPLPPDGSCSSYYNTYWYTPVGQKKNVNGKSVHSDYTYDLCFGEPVGGYPAGLARLTPEGVTGGLVCDSQDTNCKASENASSEIVESKDEVDAILDKLNFAAEFNVDATYGNYGKIRAVEEPKEFFDLTEMLSRGGSYPSDEGLNMNQ
ncbi:MAG: hypothetical protein JNN11_02195 [Candidatus Doudnabacteria bacterium]|nr:hypothetical protein [Candidatus Doudnabacteria bacterium]